MASSRAAAPRVPCALLSRTPFCFGVAGALNWWRPPQYRLRSPQTKIRKPGTFRCQQRWSSCKSGKSTRNRALQSRGEQLSQQARSRAFRSSKGTYTHPMPARRCMLRRPETLKLYSRTKCPCNRCGTPRRGAHGSKHRGGVRDGIARSPRLNSHPRSESSERVCATVHGWRNPPLDLWS